MKKIFIFLLIVLCAFIVFKRPAALAVAADDEHSVFLSFEPAFSILPETVFDVVSALPSLVFVQEYFEEGQLARCLEGYFLTSRERPPPQIFRG